MSLSALLFNRSDSVDTWTQTDIDDILFHGGRMYLHAPTNDMVPDTDTLSINELPKMATSQTYVEYCLNYSEFCQGPIDRSFCGEGAVCLLRQVLINAFSNSPSAMLVLQWLCHFMCLIQMQEIGLGTPDESGTAIGLEFTELDEFQNHLET